MCCNLFKIDVQWPQDVSTSPWLPQWIYVRLVGLVTTLFLAFQIVHLMDFFPKFGWFYFVFLTNWALVLESLTLLLLWVSTIWAYGSAPGEGQKAPLFVRYALSLWYIIQPMSLVGDPLLDCRQPVLGSICHRILVPLGTPPKLDGVDCAFVCEQPTMVLQEWNLGLYVLRGLCDLDDHPLLLGDW